MELADLGRRIVICGPSNAGKSTLAAALGRKLDLPVVHLDVLFHKPHTLWEPRPREEFTTLHDAAIGGDSWIVEGNYFRELPQRLRVATGLVLLGSEPYRAAFRYVRRTLFQRDRPGILAGGQDRLSWVMARLILIDQPKKRVRDLALLEASGLPLLQLKSMRELKELYVHWELGRT